jgi:hypothetical protein
MRCSRESHDDDCLEIFGCQESRRRELVTPIAPDRLPVVLVHDELFLSTSIMN